MLSRLLSAANRVLASAGYAIKKLEPFSTPSLSDQPPWVNEIIARVKPYTMTSPERIASLCNAVEYLNRAGIGGDIVECGVWKGGSMMAVALTLMRFGGEEKRKLKLFDTFDGMSLPTDEDKTIYSGKSGKVPAAELMEGLNATYVPPSLEEVQHNMRSIGFPHGQIEFIKGKVEEMIPNRASSQIALLRLDTDWYESTRHELVHLYPHLTSGGVLIIDDYGNWEGARKAVDEYFTENKIPILLNRIDYTGRIAVKP
jgi:hypothetical protein